MSKVNVDNFITIQGWMVSDLQLKGTELMVYAIIFGFSQDGKSVFNGSRQYLADWCNCSVRNIQLVLNSLVDNEYLIKYEDDINGVKVVSYATNFTRGEKISLNNIVYNNSNLISKDIKLDEPQKFEFGESKIKKSNLFEKCLALIDDYTNNAELKQVLVDYFYVLVEVYRGKDKQLYANMFKGKLNKLSTLSSNIKEQIQIVNNAISGGWENFYPLKDDYSKPTNPDTNKSVQKKVDIDNISDKSY